MLLSIHMNDYKSYFKGKRVTVLGLGLLGKRLHDIHFLSKMGAEVTVTDLKTAKELAPSIQALKGYKNITFSLGEHLLTDFENRDFILKGQGTPLDSLYIAHARKRGIPIEMDESLFLKLAPKNIKVIGVTGTRGKTTVTMLIYHILKKAGVRVHLGGNILGTAALPLLAKVRSGDTVVFELSSWQLQGFGDAKISPHIAVFTNFMKDHLNYYGGSMTKYFKDKSFIYSSQKKGDHLIIGESLKKKIKNVPSKVTVATGKRVPADWETYLRGAHNAANIACAVEACRAYGISEENIKKGLATFKGVPGRLEYVRVYKDIAFYNDTCATTPEALLAGVTALSNDDNIVLVAGGTDKGLDVSVLTKALPKYISRLVLLPGTGTDKLSFKTKDSFHVVFAKNLKDAVTQAIKMACPGDTILFSPGFASFGMFKNEYDRGEQFMKIVKGLK